MRSFDSYGVTRFLGMIYLFFGQNELYPCYDEMIPGLLFLIQQDRYLFMVAALVRIQRAESNTENNLESHHRRQ